MTIPWPDVDLSGDPRLLVGRRKSSKLLDLHRLEVDQELFADLRSIAYSALGELDRRDAKPYSEFAAATNDDYFLVDTTDLPKRRDHRRSEDHEEAWHGASVLRMAHEADGFTSLTAEELREFDANLYAFAFEHGDGYICFVRKQSPRRQLKPGLRFLRFGDTVRKIEAPDLAIDDAVDLVLTGDQCAILNPGAFLTLFGDIGVAFKSLQANAAAIEQALSGVLPLGDGAVAALRARCGRRLSDARRLHRLIEEKAAAIEALTEAGLTTLLMRRGLEVVDDGRISLDDETAGAFLDLLDGRFFEDDITRAPRRADAYSPR